MNPGRAFGWAVAAALAAMLAAAGCQGGREADPAVADVGGTPVRLSELERYLAESLPEGADAEPATPEQQDEVKSRLLDDLVDEQRLAMAAARRGITVAPDELEAYLRDAVPPEGAAPSPDPGRKADAMREILAQKLRETAAHSAAAVTSEEADAYLQANRATLEAEGVPTDPVRAEAALRERARERLAVARGEAATEKLLESLRKSIPATIRRDRLPFPYRAATP